MKIQFSRLTRIVCLAAVSGGFAVSAIGPSNATGAEPLSRRAAIEARRAALRAKQSVDQPRMDVASVAIDSVAKSDNVDAFAFRQDQSEVAESKFIESMFSDDSVNQNHFKTQATEHSKRDELEGHRADFLAMIQTPSEPEPALDSVEETPVKLSESDDAGVFSASDYQEDYERIAVAKRLKQERAIYRANQRLMRYEYNQWRGHEPLRPAFNTIPYTSSRYRRPTIYVPIYVGN